MFKKIAIFSFILIALCSAAALNNGGQNRILIFSATRGFRHNSIPAGKEALMKIAKENKWEADTSEDPSVFNTRSLEQYKAIIFLNTTGSIFNDDQKTALQNYIRNGGGYVGIHSATDTEKDWPWYNELAGAVFSNHPVPQLLRYNIIEKNFPATSFMPDTITRFEEIYNFDKFRKDLVHVLITADETTYKGGTMPGFHPAAWYHEFEGGRAFYTAWGHHSEAFQEPLFLRQLTEAIRWAMHEH